MRRPDFIAKQGRCPSGILGSLLGRVMAAETAAENALALESLEIRPSDHILEIGYGHGRTIARAARIATTGFVAGVDWSERMFQVATRYNRRLLMEGRVELKLGTSSRLPYTDRCFDKAYSVHTIYFWTTPVEDLREIGRVMKPGARLVLGFRPSDQRGDSAFPDSIYKHYSPEEVRALLEEAGFGQIHMMCRQPSNRPFCSILATRGD